ncbi:unnamed protein product [Spirodela intermedia]|uniref:Dolichyl-diphosphooligosaccharide--protein glycosyltransferase subunit 2 n=1 Tax=Spirodela intermedia TaxID=51605 RepID=A0A7I8J8Y3_SPIIN|nr:unnamed protein product [Spirodela intermedia]CAA6666451.1 unnamed protein product [Spirodela intermedia]
MAGNMRLLAVLCLISLCLSAYGRAAAVAPIKLDAHRSAALEAFVPFDGSFGGLEETYEALRTYQILGLDKGADIRHATCPLVLESLSSSSSSLKDIFDSLRVNTILQCKIDANKIKVSFSRCQWHFFILIYSVDATSLVDLYLAVESMLLIKEEGFTVVPGDTDGIFHSIKSFSQSDGRWRYSANGGEGSTYAAGLALEALAGVISLSTNEIDQSMISIVKNDIVKLFDIIESYDDGAMYFDEKQVDAREYRGPLSTTSSVIRGITKFAAVASGKLDIPREKIVGLAKFFLSIGVPGNAKDLFHQVDSLSYLENNRVGVPLIVSLPGAALSLTSKDQLKVKVTTVFGTRAPPLTVKLVQALDSDSKNIPALEDKELNFDAENLVHSLDIVSLNVDMGKYSLFFKILLHESEHESIYATARSVQLPLVVMGLLKIDGLEIAVLDTDVTETQKSKATMLDLSKENAVSLSASHLQKLSLTFQLTTPLGHVFNSQQRFLKLRHESKVEHIFLVGRDDRRFKIVLDFLGLVEKFYYLSGRYEIELTVATPARGPEKAARPPPQPVDAYLRFGPKAEISHIFRAPEKRPPKELSVAFLVLTLLPLLVFIVGLLRLGVNLKNFPSSAVPALLAILFHVGIGAVLSLYVLFWLKLDLFIALKALAFLGAFLVLVGHRTLTHLASTAAKLKSS